MRGLWGDVLWSAAILGFLGLSFWGVKHLQKRAAIAPELSRKLVHMVMAVAVLPFPWVFAHRLTVVIIGSLATLGLLGVRLFSDKDGELGGVLYRVGRLRSVGELLYPPAVVVTYLLAPTPVDFVIPILVLGFADSLAALVGTQYAKVQLAGNREDPKSFEGAVAFAFAAFVCVVAPLLLLSDLDGPTILMVSLLIAAISALLELVCSFGMDNFLVPFIISVFLRRLASLEFNRLVLSFGLLLLYLGVAVYLIHRLNITKLGAVEALLVIFLTTLLGDFYWVAAPFILAFTYAVFPPLSREEQERPLNYHDIETNLLPGLLIVVAGALWGRLALCFWVYATYYACLTAKNYSLRLFNYFPQQKNALLLGFARGMVLQLLPAWGMYLLAFGTSPLPAYFGVAAAGVMLELVVSDCAVRSRRFPVISLRLGWISSLSSLGLSALLLLLPLAGF